MAISPERILVRYKHILNHQHMLLISQSRTKNFPYLSIQQNTILYFRPLFTANVILNTPPLFNYSPKRKGVLINTRYMLFSKKFGIVVYTFP